MSCSRTQHGGGRSRIPDLSLRSPTLYHWATALPWIRTGKNDTICLFEVQLLYSASMKSFYVQMFKECHLKIGIELWFILTFILLSCWPISGTIRMLEFPSCSPLCADAKWIIKFSNIVYAKLTFFNLFKCVTLARYYVYRWVTFLYRYVWRTR